MPKQMAPIANIRWATSCHFGGESPSYSNHATTIPEIIADMPNMVNVKKLETLSGPVASPEPPKPSNPATKKVNNAKPIKTNPLIVKK